MGSILPVPSSPPPLAANRRTTPNQVQRRSSSLFGNLLRRTEVAIGVRSQTGFSSGATYDTQTIAGQTKATLNSAVNATKCFLHIK